MNVQHIVSTVEMLRGLGFAPSIGNLILKRISFCPASFTIHQRKEHSKDVINFQLFFAKDTSNLYPCIYYDAILRKEIEIPKMVIENISVLELEQRMAEIDWRNFITIREDQSEAIEPAAGWKQEQDVEGIVKDLNKIGSLEAGKEISDRLKIKYWADTPVQELFSDLNTIKSKFEISQRFYLLEGQEGISTEESYRFLNNRWLEKKLFAERKHMGFYQKQEKQTSNTAVKAVFKQKTKNKTVRSKNDKRDKNVA